MQTESMSRLLRKNTVRTKYNTEFKYVCIPIKEKDKWEIVGYEHHINGIIVHYGFKSQIGKDDPRMYDILDDAEYCGIMGRISHPTYIKHDAFEQGIEVAEKWWFSGDRLEFEYHGDICHGVLKGPTYGGTWKIRGDVNIYLWEVCLDTMKLIGNIHEIEEN